MNKRMVITFDTSDSLSWERIQFVRQFAAQLAAKLLEDQQSGQDYSLTLRAVELAQRLFRDSCLVAE